MKERCHEYDVSGTRERRPGPPDEPLALAGQVVVGHPPLRRAGVPVAGLLRHERGCVLRHSLHRPLSAEHLRVQRRRPAVELAGGLLRVRRPRHRPLPPVHAARRAGLPGTPRGRVPRTPVAGTRAREVVAARDPALHRGRPARRWRRVCAAHRARPAGGVGFGPHRHPGARRRSAAPVHRSLPAAALRPRARPEPVGAARRGVRRPDDRPLPTVQPRPGRSREPGRWHDLRASPAVPTPGHEPTTPASGPASRGVAGARFGLDRRTCRLASSSGRRWWSSRRHSPCRQVRCSRPTPGHETPRDS